MGHVYPQERERERWHRGDSRLKGHCLRGKERLKDIDVKMEERDEERQLEMERRLLALKRQRDDETNERQK